MKDLFPKVLILNVSFTSIGSGITVRNLFYSWPKSKLANANLEIVKDNKVCNSYFKLSTEKNVNLKKMINENNDNLDQVLDKHAFHKGVFKNLTIGLKNYLEQKYLINRIIIDDKLINWILSNNFDIIYAVPFVARDIPFLINLKRKTNLPLAIHVFDDWIEHNRFGYFKFIFKPLLARDFRKLVKIAELRIAICEQMKIAYEKRYKVDFHFFHNPSSDISSNYSPNLDKNKSYFKITFVGTIGEHNIELFLALGKAIDALKEENVKIKIRFVGYIAKPYIVDVLKEINNFEINEPRENEKIKEILVDSDILFLPLSFSKSQKNYIQYSMPSKTSEYMASGTPILVMAPEGYALTNYALKEKWAYVLTEIDINLLALAIKELCCDTVLRSILINRSREVFFSNHNIEKVSSIFRELLTTKSVKSLSN